MKCHKIRNVRTKYSGKACGRPNSKKKIIIKMHAIFFLFRATTLRTQRLKIRPIVSLSLKRGHHLSTNPWVSHFTQSLTSENRYYCTQMLLLRIIHRRIDSLNITHGFVERSISIFTKLLLRNKRSVCTITLFRFSRTFLLIYLHTRTL